MHTILSSENAREMEREEKGEQREGLVVVVVECRSPVLVSSRRVWWMEGKGRRVWWRSGLWKRSK